MVNIGTTAQVEFDGTGAPTGNLWIIGKKFVVPVSDLPTATVTDGKTTTKYRISFTVQLQDGSGGGTPTSGQSVVIQHPSSGKKVSSTLT